MTCCGSLKVDGELVKFRGGGGGGRADRPYICTGEARGPDLIEIYQRAPNLIRHGQQQRRSEVRGDARRVFERTRRIGISFLDPLLSPGNLCGILQLAENSRRIMRRRSNSSHERERRTGRSARRPERSRSVYRIRLSGARVAGSAARVSGCAPSIPERGTRVTPKSFPSGYDSLLRAPPGTTQRSRAPRAPRNARRRRARDRYGATYAHARSMTRSSGADWAR